MVWITIKSFRHSFDTNKKLQVLILCYYCDRKLSEINFGKWGFFKPFSLLLAESWSKVIGETSGMEVLLAWETSSSVAESTSESNRIIDVGAEWTRLVILIKLSFSLLLLSKSRRKVISKATSMEVLLAWETSSSVAESRSEPNRIIDVGAYRSRKIILIELSFSWNARMSDLK